MERKQEEQEKQEKQEKLQTVAQRKRWSFLGLQAPRNARNPSEQGFWVQAATKASSQSQQYRLSIITIGDACMSV